MTRFDGRGDFVERLCYLDVSALRIWALNIALDAWPKVAGSMRTIEWLDAGEAVAPLTSEIMGHFAGGSARQHYLSMILTGHSIAAHRDEQEISWICRVHVPIMTNLAAWITIEGKSFHLPVGAAYKVNTLKEHSVFNGGMSPRLHWMFDVHAETPRL